MLCKVHRIPTCMKWEPNDGARMQFESSKQRQNNRKEYCSSSHSKCFYMVAEESVELAKRVSKFDQSSFC